MSNYDFSRPAGNFGGGNFDHKNRITLKEALRKDWMIYRTAGSPLTVFKPYPVYNEQGQPCPPLNDAAAGSDLMHFLPAAFVRAPLVSFAGLRSDLEFVDFVSDAANYFPPNVEISADTPYSALISKLREMSAHEKDAQAANGQDGFPVPQQLRALTKNLSFASMSLICRGALFVHRNERMKVKRAVNGTLLKALICISQKSACNAFLEELVKQMDETQPVSATNCVLQHMFAPDRGAIALKRTGPQPTDPFACKLEGSFVNEFMGVVSAPESSGGFACQPNVESYHAKVRESFGPFQSVGSCLNILTAAEMTEKLLECYPISWVWYALKDTCFAATVSDSMRERATQEARQDYAMAGRFGMEPPAQLSGGGGWGQPAQQQIQQNGWGAPQPVPAQVAQAPQGGGWSAAAGYGQNAPQGAPSVQGGPPRVDQAPPQNYGGMPTQAGGFEKPAPQTNTWGQAPDAVPMGTTTPPAASEEPLDPNLEALRGRFSGAKQPGQL